MKNKIRFLIVTLSFLLGVVFHGTMDVYFSSASADSVVEKLVKSCEGIQERSRFIHCFISGARRQKPEAAHAMASELEDMVHEGEFISSELQLRCHDIAHSIGQYAFEHSETISQAFFRCTAVCGAGCFHGVLERSIAEMTRLDTFVETACLGDVQTSANRWACYHGMGHGLGSVSHSIDEALEYCAIIPQLDDEKNCIRGVFMEMLESPNLYHETLDIPEDLHVFCSNLAGAGEEVCFENIGIDTYIRDMSYQNAFEACQSSPAQHRQRCFMTLGTAIYGNLLGSPSDIIDICMMSNDPLWCVLGAVHQDILQDPDVRVAPLLCDNFSDDSRDVCFGYMGQRIESIYTREKREKLCHLQSPNDSTICMESQVQI